MRSGLFHFSAVAKPGRDGVPPPAVNRKSQIVNHKSQRVVGRARRPRRAELTRFCICLWCPSALPNSAPPSDAMVTTWRIAYRHSFSTGAANADWSSSMRLMFASVLPMSESARSAEVMRKDPLLLRLVLFAGQDLAELEADVPARIACDAPLHVSRAERSDAEERAKSLDLAFYGAHYTIIGGRADGPCKTPYSRTLLWKNAGVLGDCEWKVRSQENDAFCT